MTSRRGATPPALPVWEVRDGDARTRYPDLPSAFLAQLKIHNRTGRFAELWTTDPRDPQGDLAPHPVEKRT